MTSPERTVSEVLAPKTWALLTAPNAPNAIASTNVSATVATTKRRRVFLTGPPVSPPPRRTTPDLTVCAVWLLGGRWGGRCLSDVSARTTSRPFDVVHARHQCSNAAVKDLLAWRRIFGERNEERARASGLDRERLGECGLSKDCDT